ncbi:MAG TPA: inositol monophosphatase family protein [Phycisphaerae bacterium]|nr:inositol monophosphatase family protein [Phycisphaerae bacterium]HRW55727.1 inositol monophosphatase family protein [Phycisphaerae bacterium]
MQNTEINEQDRRRDAVREFAKIGGDVVMRFFRGANASELGVEIKEEGNLVSQADLASERAILERIRASFPEDAVLAEETASTTQAADRLWIIDPLDGTNNFAHGLPWFSVSVAYYEQGEPRHGAVLNPVSGELFFATRGGGAVCNDRKLCVSSAESIADCLVATGFYYDRGESMRATLRHIEGLFTSGVHGIRRFGCASLDMCGVAAGCYGAYFEHFLSPWDFAAGRLIVEEAGGRVTDYRGESLGTKPSSIVVTNGPLHDEMLRRLAS